jgi:DNA-binding transcriptional MerR regulator
MLDLSRFEGNMDCRELVEEIKKLRSAGKLLEEVAEMISADQEPLHPDCVKCEHLDQTKARKALQAWRAL